MLSPEGFDLIQHPPKVFVIGASQVQSVGMNAYLNHRGVQWNRKRNTKMLLAAENVETIVEASGRVCYHSWDNKSEKSMGEYIQSSIIEHAHGSVLEHVWLNFMVADLPRSYQLELVRHGDGTAFSFESTRFTDEHLRFVVPPRIRGNVAAVDAWYESVRTAVRVYRNLLSEIDANEPSATLRRKRRKEAARSILPACQGSDGVVSMNARSLRWITEVRSDPGADLSIREFANEVFIAAQEYMPSILADASFEDDGEGVLSIKYATKKV
jgi:thymidylate synthase (FAD)